MGDGSAHGALRGASWSMWRDELGPSCLGERGSPIPMEDVMKLPRDDMSTLGRWPAWDSFTLVTCDKCSRNVKLEAFESHVTLRHGTKSERSAYQRGTAAKAAALLSCQVRLTPATSPQHTQHSHLLERLEARVMPTSSTSSSLGSTGPASPQPHVHLVESSTTTPTRTPSPAPPPVVQEEEVAMDTSPSPPPPPPPPAPPSPAPQHTHKQPPPFREDEADSTTNNVISIPDSDEMANIEIISDGLDLLNTKFNFSSPAVPTQPTLVQTSANSTTFSSTTSACSVPSLGGPTPHNPSPLLPSPLTPLRPSMEPMEVDQSLPPAPTHYITVSPLSKCAPSPKKMVIGRLPAPQEKKVTGREREYDPNRHCGVWDSEQKRNCTRSLTCKSHSVYLKRKVINRTGPFDELLAQHKAEKEATTVRSSSSASVPEFLESRLETSSILERRLKLATSIPIKQEVVGRVVGSIQVIQPNIKPAAKEIYCDDSLHYTTDHPKPLAVCTFGGKRIGGLFITDRSRLFTRKVMKLGIGRNVTPVPRQQALPYIVNFQSGVSSLSGHTIKLASGLQPTQQIVVQEAFKSDIGDFKGGLKFELGGVSRQMHHIVPSGSDGAG